MACYLVVLGWCSLIAHANHYVAGVVRTQSGGSFAATGFSPARTPGLVQTSLTSEGKPVSNTGLNLDNWWTTGDTTKQFTAVMSENGGDLTWVEHQDWTDLQNTAYTMELQVDIRSGNRLELNFASAGDLWVFSGPAGGSLRRQRQALADGFSSPGKLVLDNGGNHPTEPLTVTCSGCTCGGVNVGACNQGSNYYFRLYIFYAKRAPSTTGAINFVLGTAVKDGSCSAATAVVPVPFAFTKATTPAGDVVAACTGATCIEHGAYTSLSGNTITLIPGGTPSNNIAYAWLTTTQRVYSGFQSTFKFTFSNANANGFAFVYQTFGVYASSTAGDYLGYYFAKSMALEFSNKYNEIRLMTQYGAINNALSATQAQLVSGSITFNSFTANTEYTAKVVYDPATGNDGNIFLYLSQGGTLRKTIVWQVDNSRVQGEIGGSGHLGFTAGSDHQITVSDWKVYAVRPSGPASTFTTSSWQSAVANDQLAQLVQATAKDGCGRETATLDFSSAAFDVSCSFVSPSAKSASEASRNLGTVTYRIRDQTAGVKQLNVKIDGSHLLGSPFDVTILPGAVAASGSSWIFDEASYEALAGGGNTVTVAAGENVRIVATARDRFSNEQPATASFQFKVQLADTIGTLAKDGATAQYVGTVTSKIAATAKSCNVFYNSVNLARISTVDIVPAGPNPLKSELSIPNTIEAGQQFVVTLTLNDEFQNRIEGNQGTATLVIAEGGTGIVNEGMTWQSTTKRYEYTVAADTLTDSSKEYSLNIDLGGVEFNALNRLLIVVPGAADAWETPALSSTSISAGNVVIATLQEVDEYGNPTRTAASQTQLVSLALDAASTTVTCPQAPADETDFSGVACTLVAGQFQVEFTPIKVGAVTVTVASVASGAITVTPGQVSQLSDISAPPGDVTAGEWATIALGLVDRYSNNIASVASSDIISFNFRINNVGQQQFIDPAVENPSPGVFRFKFNLTAAGDYDVSMSFKGSTTVWKTFTTTCLPAAPDRNNFVFNGIADQQSYAIGTTLQFTVLARDRFDNRLLPAPAMSNYVLEGVQPAATITPSSDAGLLLITVSFQPHTTDGQTLVFKYDYDGSTEATPGISIRVVTGAAHASTLETAASFVAVAGDSIFQGLTILYKDTSGNDILAADALNSASLQLVLESTVSGQQQYSSKVTYTGVANKFQVEMVLPFVAGSYTPSILLNALAGNDPLGPIEVVPGNPVAGTSRISLDKAQYGAGDTIAATVLLADLYGNEIDTDLTPKDKIFQCYFSINFQEVASESASFNTTSKRYECSTTITTATPTLSIAVRQVGGVGVDIASIDVEVLAGPVTTFKVETLPGTGSEAGRAGEKYAPPDYRGIGITFLDQWDNPAAVEESIWLNGKVTVTTAGTPTIVSNLIEEDDKLPALILPFRPEKVDLDQTDVVVTITTGSGNPGQTFELDESKTISLTLDPGLQLTTANDTQFPREWTADERPTFTFKPLDPFGNLMLNRLSDFSTPFMTVVSNDNKEFICRWSQRATVSCACAQPYEDVGAFTLTATWQLQSEPIPATNIVFDGGDTAFTVTPGKVHAPNTVFTASRKDYFAGLPYGANITFRDRFDNNIVQGDNTFPAMSDVSLSLIPGTVTDGSYACARGTTPVDGTIQVDQFVDIAGVGVTFSTDGDLRKAATYTVELKIEGQYEKTCERQRVVIVNPAQFSPPDSDVLGDSFGEQGLYALVTSGNKTSMRITLRDKYGNKVLNQIDGARTVMIGDVGDGCVNEVDGVTRPYFVYTPPATDVCGTPVSNAATSQVACQMACLESATCKGFAFNNSACLVFSDDGTTTCVAKASFQYSADEDFVLSADMLAVKEGIYSLRVKVNDKKVETLKNLGLPDKCSTVFVRSSYADKFQPGSFSGTYEGPKLYAGVPVIVPLTAEDRFLNPVPSVDIWVEILKQEKYEIVSKWLFQGHSYNVELSRTGGSEIAVDNYKTQAHPTQGFLIDRNTSYAIVIPAYHGQYTTRTTLVVSPECENNCQVPPIQTNLQVHHATCANVDDGFDKPYQCHAAGGQFTCVASRSGCAAVAADTTASPNKPAQFQSDCPVGTVGCPDGSCAPENECPTAVTCPKGYKKCSDDNCVHAETDCNPIQCAGNSGCGNRCADVGEHCPTMITCAPGKLLCPDGSCTNSTECPDVFKCYYPFSHRCPDGSCRASAASCPTPVTCMPGMIMCESGMCAKNLRECLALEVECDFMAGEVRCGDGSCRPNLFLCPTPITCPQGFVKCADGSCKADVYQCNHPQIHVPVGSKLCPDGSLVKSYSAEVAGETVVTTAKCPSGITCPFPTLVKCPDGLCVQTIEDCSPVETPCEQMRCPDGSCRAMLKDCPTPLECPDSRPVRCPSGQCAQGPLECLDSEASLEALTCPEDMVRCFTGECVKHRQFCPTHTTCPIGNTRCYDGTCKKDCTRRDSIDIECVSGISCPRGSSGSTCVKHIKDCPIASTCPASMPIKCHDASCVFSLEDCPPKDSSDSLKVACPDGGFYSEFNLCSQMTSCPPELPVKCWDQTCREHPKDCPAMGKCSARSKPYLCPSGICAGSPEDCVTSSARCTVSEPVKCAFSVKTGTVSVAKCGASVEECAISEVDEPQCPNRASRCLDGSCRALPIDCPALKCPVFLPYMCSNGHCVMDRKECADDETGCPVARPFKCFWGGCAESAQLCDEFFSLSSAGAKCETDGHKRCADGSCATKCDVGVNGCAPGQILCHHRVCLSPNQCIGQSISGGKEFGGNVCPFQKPYKCDNGMCAQSFSKCPIYAMDFAKCDGVRCADGTCEKSSAQCPVAAPCKIGQRRCPDGACIDATRECPWFYPACPKEAEYLCESTGLCVPKLSLCPETVDGCPLSMQKCPDGHCVPKGAVCPTGNATCTEKCWDGSCKGDADCPTSKCRNAPNSAETDGCDASVMNHNNCPVSSPIRCADGSCAKFPYYHGYTKNDGSACAIHNGCQGDTPHMCADGSCVEVPQFCRPIICEDPEQVYCWSTQSCAASCPAAEACPAERPVVCKSGLCVSSISKCIDPHVPDRCSIREVQCFDGFCGKTYSECVDRTKAVMPECTHICSDGTCVDAIAKCPTIEKCPLDQPLRCPTSVCRKDLKDCPQVLAGEDPTYAKSCPRGERKCDDGACRRSCPPSRACPDKAPYFCHKTRSCLSFSLTDTDKARTDCENRDVLQCGEDCNQHVIATAQTLSISPGAVDVPLAQKNGGTNARLMLYPGAVMKPMTLSLTPVSNPGSSALSTAFKCTKAKGDSDFVLGGVVEAAVDRKIFTSSAKSDVNVKFPCTFFSRYRVTLANGNQGFCRGSAEIQNGKLTLQIFKEGTICPALDFEADLQDEVVVRNGEVCAKVKTNKGRVMSLGMTYDGNKQPQLVIQGETNVIANGEAPDATLQGCNFTEVAATVNTTTFSLVKEDSSDQCLDKGNEQEIAPRDICFARRVGGGAWQCLHTDAQRITWDFNASYGQPLSWMQGKIDRCDGAEYAFTYLVLPPPDIPIVAAFDWWAAYGDVFLGIFIPIILIGLAISYFIYKACKDKKGYQEEKRQLDILHDKHAQVAEFEGGLGVADADGDLEMTPNQMIINQQTMANNLTAMAATHHNLEQRDNERMDELAAQRQEIQQKKVALQAEIDKANANKKVNRIVNEESDQKPPPVTTASTAAAAQRPAPMKQKPPQQKKPQQKKKNLN